MHVANIFLLDIKGEPELTDLFNLLINVKLRMLWNWNFSYLKEEIFMVILYPSYELGVS